MVTHIVFWKLKDEALGADKAENAKQIKQRLEALVGIIPGLIEAKVGINENGGNGRPYKGFIRSKTDLFPQ